MENPNEIRFRDLSAELRDEVAAGAIWIELLQVDEVISLGTAINYLWERNPVVVLKSDTNICPVHRVVFDDPQNLSD